MKYNFTFEQLKKLYIAFLLMTGALIFGQANGPALEMTAGSGNTVANGPTTVAQTIFFQNNTDNTGAGTTFTTYAPTLSATYAISNIRSGNVINFGQTTTGAVPIFELMNAQGAPADANFTSAGAAVGTGIVGATNRAVRLYVQTLPLRTANRPTNSTTDIADLTITFNRPVNNPVIHLGGLGGTSSTTPVLGFSALLDLTSFVGTNVSLTRLSGNGTTSFQATSTSISNGSTTFASTGVNSGSGSVRVNGTGITSLTFKIAIKGDGVNTAVTAWSPNNDAAVGEAFSVGFSTLESDIQLTKTMANTTAAVGATTSFTVTATNNGPSNNANINITDVLPTGYAFNGTPTATVGTYNAGTGVWNIPTLNNATSAILTIPITVLATGNYINTAAITSAALADSNTGNNRATAARLPDSDGDGVFDNVDLDDDNDGIPDTLEDSCLKTNQIVNGNFSGSATSWASGYYATPNTTGALNFNGSTLEILVDNAGSLYSGNVILANTAPINLRAGVYYNFSSTLNIFSGTTNVNFAWVLLDASNNIVQTIQTYKTLASGVGDVQITNTATAYPVTFFATGTGSYRLAMTWVTNSAASGNGQDVRIDDVILLAPCNSDADGIPNYLDLDSDNDGCFDAIEGDENVIPGQLNADGSINTSTTGGIGTTVGTNNGVPNLVNSAGVADTGRDVGQGTGDSQSSAANTQCIDTDGDGIPNNLDLDDDNDGILDTVEDACVVEGVPVYTNDFGTGAAATTDDLFVIGHTRVTGDPGDGFYIVTTSGARTATYTRTDLTQELDAGNLIITNGSANGRYLMININSAGTVNQAIYRTNSLPVTVGSRYRFRLDLAGLANGAVDVPDLQISLKDASGNILATANSGSLGMANDDVWRRLSFNFIATTANVVLEVVNLQGNTAGGNDIGIDNIVLVPITICDKDGDGIPNSQDLDSDADGCFDAIEGGENVLPGQLNPNGSINTGSTGGLGAIFGANAGVPNLVNAGGTADTGSNVGQGIGQSQDASKNDCIDSDGDTVPDWQDLDDDNDGILDLVECPGANTVINGDFSNGLTNWTSTGGWTILSGFAYNNTDGAVNQALSQSLTNLDKRMAGNLPLNLSIGAGDGSSVAGSTASLEIRLNNVLYATLTNTVDRAVGTNNILITMANGATSNFVPFSTASQPVTQLQNFTINIPYTGPATAPLTFVMNAQNDDWAIDNISLPVYICDADGDGIPNYLDLDSDNDGCTDAIEGGANFTNANLVAATGSISTQTPNQNLGNTVGSTATTIGVPTVAGTGQSVGQSQDASKNDCLDSDGDGVPDWQDLDDDNDGILDTVECPPTNVFANYTTATIANSTPTSTVSNITFGSVTGTLSRVFNGTTGGSIAVISSNFSNATIYTPAGSATQSTLSEFNSGYKGTSNFTRYTLTLSAPVESITLQIDGYDYMKTRFVGNHVEQLLSGGTEFVYDPATRQLYDSNPLTTGVQTRDGFGSVRITSRDGLPFTQIVYEKFDDPNSTSGNLNTSDGFNYTFSVVPACDSDGDGIPNRLDLDSDGDGCFDALEGDENVQLGQLNANGSINTTTTGGLGNVSTNLGVPNLVNSGGTADIGGDVGQGVGDSQNALINLCYCYKKPVLDAGSNVPVQHGITALTRAGGGTTEWPTIRQSAWTVLEANTKGFVVNKVAFEDADNNATTPTTPVGIPTLNYVEGMMVYDTIANCLKIYNGTFWNCYSTQTCPPEITN